MTNRTTELPESAIYDTDAPIEVSSALSESEAEELLLKRFLPADASPSGADEDEDRKRKPAEDESETPDSDENAEDSEQDAPEDDGDEDEKEQKARKYVESDDDTFIKVTVGDEVHEVPVKDLQRLFGQEAALTRKSQETAEVRKAAEAEQTKAVAVLDVMLKQAKEAAAPFAQMDFLALAKDPDVTAEELSYIRQQAQAAFDNVRFLEGELGGFMKAIETKNNEELGKQARATLKALSDPKTGLEGWSEKLYDDIRAYAITEGMDANIINKLVDEKAIRLLHKAMMFDRGKSKAVTVKQDKKPTKIVKTSNRPAARTGSAPKAKKVNDAMKNLQSKGNDDAAIAAIMARWESDE